jgi:hypothetical protein
LTPRRRCAVWTRPRPWRYPPVSTGESTPGGGLLHGTAWAAVLEADGLVGDDLRLWSTLCMRPMMPGDPALRKPGALRGRAVGIRIQDPPSTIGTVASAHGWRKRPYPSASFTWSSIYWCSRRPPRGLARDLPETALCAASQRNPRQRLPPVRLRGSVLRWAALRTDRASMACKRSEDGGGGLTRVAWGRLGGPGRRSRSTSGLV